MSEQAVREELSAVTFLRLVGHPLRWQLLGELGRSDRVVGELTDLVGEKQNLVSYHLGQLRKAGLARSRRSAADGRDSYYAVDLARLGAMLTATGAALHPGLRLELAGPDATTLTGCRVLFLCTGNSGRSPMGAALLRARSGGAVEAHSAGSHPKPLRPEAVQVLRSGYGVDIADHRPTHLDTYVDQRFDRVISLCDRVREVCPEMPGAADVIHWSIPDPAATDGDDDARTAAFERTAAELDSRIGFLLGALTRPG